MKLMHVAKVGRCRCAKHAWVRLEDVTGERAASIQVDADGGRAILGELAGLSSVHAESFDLLGAALAALGARMLHVALSGADGALTARLALCGPQGRVSIPLDGCRALVAACRLKLPLLVADEAIDGERCERRHDTPVPVAFRPLLEGLDLSGLDRPEGDDDGHDA